MRNNFPEMYDWHDDDLTTDDDFTTVDNFTTDNDSTTDDTILWHDDAVHLY